MENGITFGERRLESGSGSRSLDVCGLKWEAELPKQKLQYFQGRGGNPQCPPQTLRNKHVTTDLDEGHEDL